MSDHFVVRADLLGVGPVSEDTIETSALIERIERIERELSELKSAILQSEQ